jgi:hypothetical protein
MEHFIRIPFIAPLCDRKMAMIRACYVSRADSIEARHPIDTGLLVIAFDFGRNSFASVKRKGPAGFPTGRVLVRAQSFAVIVRSRRRAAWVTERTISIWTASSSSVAIPLAAVMASSSVLNRWFRTT